MAEPIVSWMRKAWEVTCRDISDQRYMMWKETSTIVFPFFYQLERTKKRYNNDWNVRVVPEYTVSIPENAKCKHPEHYRNYLRDDRRRRHSYDLAILRTRGEPERWTKKVEDEYGYCSIWCFEPETLVLCQAKYCGPLEHKSTQGDIQRDIKTLAAAERLPERLRPQKSCLLLIASGSFEELKEIIDGLGERPKNLYIASYLWGSEGRFEPV